MVWPIQEICFGVIFGFRVCYLALIWHLSLCLLWTVYGCSFLMLADSVHPLEFKFRLMKLVDNISLSQSRLAYLQPDFDI